MEGGSKRRRLNDDRVAEETTCTAEASQKTSSVVGLSEVLSKKRVFTEMSDTEVRTWLEDLPIDQVRYLVSSFISLKYEPRPTNQGLVTHGRDFYSDIKSKRIKRKLKFTPFSETYPHSLSDPNSLGVSLLRSIKSGLDVSEKEESIGSVNRDQMRIESIMDGIEQLRLDASGRSLLSLPHSLICECLSFLTFRELCKSVSRVSHLMFGLSKEGAAHYFVCIDESMIKKGLNTGLFDLAAMRGFNHVHFKYLNCWDPKLDDGDPRTGWTFRQSNSLTARVKTHNFKQLMQHMFMNSPRLRVLEFGTDRFHNWNAIKSDVISKWQIRRGLGTIAQDTYGYNLGFLRRLLDVIRERHSESSIQTLIFNGHMFDHCFPYLETLFSHKSDGFNISNFDDSDYDNVIVKDPRMKFMFGSQQSSKSGDSGSSSLSSSSSIRMFPNLNRVLTRSITSNLRMFVWLQNKKIEHRNHVKNSRWLHGIIINQTPLETRWLFPSMQALMKSPIIFESLLFEEGNIDDDTSLSSKSGDYSLTFGMNKEYLKALKTGDSSTKDNSGRRNMRSMLDNNGLILAVKKKIPELTPKVILKRLYSLEIWFPSSIEVSMLALRDQSRLLSMGDYQLCEDNNSVKQQLCLICDFPWFSDSTEESMSHSAPSFRRLFKECAPNLREMNWHITCESPAPNVLSEKKHPKNANQGWMYRNREEEKEIPEHPLDHEGGSQPVMIEALNQAKDIVFTELRSLTITLNAGLLIAMTSKLISPDELIDWHCSFYDDLFSSSLICRFPKLTHFRLNLAVGEHWQLNAQSIHLVCSALICRISKWIREIRKGQKKPECSCIVLSNVDLVISSIYFRMKRNSEDTKDGIWDNDIDQSYRMYGLFNSCVQTPHYSLRMRFKQRLDMTKPEHREIMQSSLIEISSDSVCELVDACGECGESRTCLSLTSMLELKMSGKRSKHLKIGDPMKLVRKLCEIKAENITHYETEDPITRQSVSLFGLGFPGHKGSPMYDYVGLIFDHDFIECDYFMGQRGCRFVL